jgi:riboflavin-specific deaminase-like protein
MSPKSKVQSPKVKALRATACNTQHATRPFILSNFAMTADGKTAFADHRYVPFTSRRDQQHMMELRATADAVMCGARTVDLSPATLGTGGAKYRRLRIKRGLREYNLRIIVSGSGTVNPNAEIFKHRSSPIIILTTERASASSRRRLIGLADDVKICGKTEINFRSAFRWLRRKWGVKRLLCEGGGELHGALIRAGLVDELHLTISPRIFGGRTSPTIADGAGFQKLADAAKLKLKSSRRVSDEMFLVFQSRI